MTHKAEMTIIDADDVRVRLTCTASVKTWRGVAKALQAAQGREYSHAQGQVLEAVREVIGLVDVHFAGHSATTKGD